MSRVIAGASWVVSQPDLRYATEKLPWFYLSPKEDQLPELTKSCDQSVYSKSRQFQSSRSPSVMAQSMLVLVLLCISALAAAEHRNITIAVESAYTSSRETL